MSNLEVALKLISVNIKSDKKSEYIRRANGKYELSMFTYRAVQFGNLLLYAILLSSIIYIFV